MHAPRSEELPVWGSGNGHLTDPDHTEPASISAPEGQDEGSEATQLDSDSDTDFFPPDAGVTGVKVDEAGRSQEDALSKEQLLLRRLDHIKELQDLYKAELWGTLEEMHARYHYFQSPDAAGAVNESSDFKPLQTVLGKRKGTEATTGNTGNKKADAGISEDDVDMVMVEASPVDQPTGAHPNDVEAAQDSSAAASAGATFEQGMQAAGHAEAADDPPTFSEAEEFVLTSSTAAADAQHLARLRQQTRARLGRMARLEQAASASTARQLDRSGALAMLSGQRVRFLIKRSAFTIGRPTSTHGAVIVRYHLKLVDVDLGKEGNASQVSRQQARCALRLNGAFTITSCGRRKLHVNGCQVERGQSAVMQHLSLLEVGGIRLLLYINHSAVRRLLARSASFGDFPGN